MRHAAVALVLGALVISLTSCKRERLAGKACAVDAECGEPAANYRCEAETGVCYCRTDDACPASQFCNTVGFCQDRSGCEKNADCLDPSLTCDTTTGSCVAVGRCSSDLQCALGSVCDVTRNTCVSGCRGNGDCNGTSCRCGDAACTCTGSTPQALAACSVGECDPYFCADDSFCRYGEVCGPLPDAGDPRNRCSNDFDIEVRPYCARCTNGGGLDTCGTGANYCITDTRTASTYCGADCSEGQGCPRGYGCRDIRVVLTRWLCNSGQACQPDPALPCTTDTDCHRGGSCIKTPGQLSGACAGQCRLREGSSFGFCSCQVDGDCVQQQCSAGKCTTNQKKCVTDADCRVIRCVEFEGVGACVIGQNCTPANGLTCVEVK